MGRKELRSSGFNDGFFSHEQSLELVCKNRGKQ